MTDNLSVNGYVFLGLFSSSNCFYIGTVAITDIYLFKINALNELIIKTHLLYKSLWFWLTGRSVFITLSFGKVMITRVGCVHTASLNAPFRFIAQIRFLVWLLSLFFLKMWPVIRDQCKLDTALNWHAFTKSNNASYNITCCKLL